jgi:hypothetical protein
LSVADKLDGVQGNLRAAESELATFKARVKELDQRFSKDFAVVCRVSILRSADKKESLPF